ncbi:BTAD domain-containing putative transcriptional regulator [Amycolatopsis sp. NPDC051128]|uniref:AfsR/SARP family transcriptional regulator n=1 Tax=Amycolatopsis sp. NPDC051128 TaxID=3155412 RepID=UPI003447ADDF
MEFGLLGSIEARAGNRSIDLGHSRQRQVLAVLLVDAERLVPVAQLVDRVWGERPPSRANSTLYSYLSRLRGALESDTAAVRIQRQSAGYRVLVDPGAVDLHRFRHLMAQARSASEAHAAVDLYAKALALWRGEPFATVDSPWFNTVRDTLLRERESAELDLDDARLRCGQHAEILPRLATRAAADPMNERLAGQFMLALYRCGRAAHALEHYDRTRMLLAEELGSDPGPALRRLHLWILEDSPVLAPPEPDPPERTEATDTPATWTRAWSAPGLLPPDVPDFTGRPAEMAALREQLTAGSPATALTIAAITGMGGVGKTALALHAAHLITASFPDGQLWINLRGAQESPLEPGDVLARFLRALGVPDRVIPAHPVERGELFRTMLAGRRVLVVLDDAASEAQVRPLLPGVPTCAVLVTSRVRLTGLEGARQINLEMFAVPEAVQLLAKVTDGERVDAQTDEAAEIVRLCGCLPLAVRIAGARLAARPAWQLAHLATILGDERRRLDRLTVGDLAVRASIALSYRGLAEQPRRLLRMYGLFKTPDFPPWLAATVLECPMDEATEYAEALVDAQLLTISETDPVGQYRYRCHDLVRLFALERAHTEEREEDRARALVRGLGGWLVLAERMAARIPGPCYASISGPTPRPAVPRVAPVRYPENWFDAERVAMLSAIRQACALGLDDLAFDLAGCLEKYFDLRGMYADWVNVNTDVMALCRRTGNLLGEAVMLRGLVDVNTWISNDHDGNAMAGLRTQATRLLDMFTELRHEPGESDALVMSAWALIATGAHESAVRAATDALALGERSGHLGGEVRAHLALAVAHFDHGDLDAGIRHATSALARARLLGNDRCVATALQFSGIAHRDRGDFDTSELMLKESLAISRRYRDTYTEVLTLLALAGLHARRGHPDARTTAETALRLSREYKMTHHQAEALETLGEIELAAGHAAAAIPLLEESVALWQSRGWHSFHAAALTSLGHAYSGVDRKAAREAFNEARALFIQLGNDAKATELEQLAKTLGEC